MSIQADKKVKSDQNIYKLILLKSIQHIQQQNPTINFSMGYIILSLFVSWEDSKGEHRANGLAIAGSLITDWWHPPGPAGLQATLFTVCEVPKPSVNGKTQRPKKNRSHIQFKFSTETGKHLYFVLYHRLPRLFYYHRRGSNLSLHLHKYILNGLLFKQLFRRQIRV